MNRHITLAIAAALGCAAAAHAQTQTAQDTTAPPPAQSASQTDAQDTTSPSSASSRHQRDTTGKTEAQEAAPAAAGPDPNDASSPHQRAATRTAEAGAGHGMTSISAGMGVQSAAGESIGTVKDVVPNASGQPGYVLIATGAGTRTAVPYSTVSSMIRNGKIVLDRARLEAAPQVQDSQLQDRADTRWQKQADQYWNGSGATRPGEPRER